jgi:arginase family protein
MSLAPTCSRRFSFALFKSLSCFDIISYVERFHTTNGWLLRWRKPLSDASCLLKRLIDGIDKARRRVPFDGGTTSHPGTRFGSQGVRRISTLYTPYNYEIGCDLRKQMSLCDVGDVFTSRA